MAHKKGVGSSKNGRESESKRLGLKKFGSEKASSCVSAVRSTIPDSMWGWDATIRSMP